MSCVSTTPRSTSHTVHVVSIEAVPTRRGSSSFQSKDVSGAAKSPPLFCGGWRAGRGAWEHGSMGERGRRQGVRWCERRVEGWRRGCALYTGRHVAPQQPCRHSPHRGAPTPAPTLAEHPLQRSRPPARPHIVQQLLQAHALLRPGLIRHTPQAQEVAASGQQVGAGPALGQEAAAAGGGVQKAGITEPAYGAARSGQGQGQDSTRRLLPCPGRQPTTWLSQPGLGASPYPG